MEANLQKLHERLFPMAYEPYWQQFVIQNQVFLCQVTFCNQSKKGVEI